MLSKEEILRAEDRKIKIIPVPEWGGEVGIRVMSGLERDRWETEYYAKQGNKNLCACLLAFCLCDEQGNLLFSEEDIEALGQKSGAALVRLFAIAKEQSALTKEDVEQLEKN